jgi:uncharacterized RDD family membrane protein YckC
VNGHVDAIEASRAGFVSRAAADLLDVFVVCIGSALVAVTIAMLGTLFAGRSFAPPRLGILGTLGGLSTVFVVYLTFFWATTGRTPGKQACGLRVTTSRGARIGTLRAAARAIVCVVLPAGLLWVVVSSRNRGLHDVLVGSAVVYDWRPRAVSQTQMPGSTLGSERVGS